MLRTERMTTRWLLALGFALGSVTVLAHEPVARCFLLDESSVRCRGASNDGDEMPGARMEVIALDGTTLLEGRLGADSTWTFRKPAQPFYVLFDTGPGLQVTVEQEEITVPPLGRTPRWMRTP
ncbi:hypothetical protein [Comamonas sp. UBA7528]|uniref:hypothetical protein n=1 Tax=Comamonas sp. UBA7528 TaxID=1946391 RepID=UPI0025BC0EE5|nr:hypothetical protein [Comamonas sp. UBA7528]